LALKAQLSTVKKQNEKIEYRKEKQRWRKTVQGLCFSRKWKVEGKGKPRKIVTYSKKSRGRLEGNEMK
jgi:hypothetical protein